MKELSLFKDDPQAKKAKKRGRPKKASAKTAKRPVKKIPQESSEKAEMRKLLLSFGMNDTSASELMERMDGRFDALREKAIWLKQYQAEKKSGLHQNTAPIFDYGGHAVNALRKFIEQQDAMQAAAQTYVTSDSTRIMMDDWEGKTDVKYETSVTAKMMMDDWNGNE